MTTDPLEGPPVIVNLDSIFELDQFKQVIPKKSENNSENCAYN